MTASGSSRPALLDRIGRFAVETRTASGQTALHVRQPPLDLWSSTPDDFILVETLKPVRATIDFGEGRFDTDFLPGEVGLNPPQREVYCRASAWQEFRLFVLPADIFSRHADAGLSTDSVGALYRRGIRSDWISMILSRLWTESRHGNPHGAVFAQAAEAMLALALVDAAGQSPVIHRGGLTPRQMKDAVARIEAGLQSGVTLADLAAGAGLSVWHFSRAFSATAGVTVTEFITRRRIDEARRLLATGRVSVLDAALATGFSSPSHFAKLFRRHTSHAPRDWLRAQR